MLICQKSMLKTAKVSNAIYWWYTFQDGYRVCVRGFSPQEFQAEIDKHGMMVKKERA